MKICITEPAPRVDVNDEHRAACWMCIKEGIENGTITVEEPTDTKKGGDVK
jgi:hypothetical protein